MKKSPQTGRGLGEGVTGKQDTKTDTGRWEAEGTGDRGDRVKFESSEDTRGGLIAATSLPNRTGMRAGERWGQPTDRLFKFC